MANYMQLAATKQVKVGAGKLYGIFVSASSSGTLTIYDSQASSTSDPKISDTISVSAGSSYFNVPACGYFSSIYCSLRIKVDHG